MILFFFMRMPEYAHVIRAMTFAGFSYAYWHSENRRSRRSWNVLRTVRTNYVLANTVVSINDALSPPNTEHTDQSIIQCGKGSASMTEHAQTGDHVVQILIVS